MTDLNREREALKSKLKMSEIDIKAGEDCIKRREQVINSQQKEIDDLKAQLCTEKSLRSMSEHLNNTKQDEINDLRAQLAALHESRISFVEYCRKIESGEYVLVPKEPTYAVKDALERPEIEHARPMTKREAKQLITKLMNYQGSTTVKNAGLTMLYSMLRTIEIRRMKWEYVDFEDKTITFPKEMMKKRRIHIVPMSEQIFQILQEQLFLVGNREYVFPSVYKKGMLSATTLNRMLDYVGLSDVTAHDFRATASTILNEKDYENDWIEKQLAHAEANKTRATYNHAKYLANRRKMLQDWADIVDNWKDK